MHGVVSERDLVRALAARRDPSSTTARAIARTRLVWCDVDSTVAELAEQIMKRYVRHVIVEHDGQVVGMVSARDLLGAYAAAEVVGENCAWHHTTEQLGRESPCPATPTN